MSDPIDLRARAMHALNGPGVRKTRVLTWAEHCEERARSAYESAVDTAGGRRACARAAEMDESTIRQKCDGAKAVHLRDVFKLPKAGAYQLAKELLDWADSLPADERTGT